MWPRRRETFVREPGRFSPSVSSLPPFSWPAPGSSSLQSGCRPKPVMRFCCIPSRLFPWRSHSTGCSRGGRISGASAHRGFSVYFFSASLFSSLYGRNTTSGRLPSHSSWGTLRPRSISDLCTGDFRAIMDMPIPSLREHGRVVEGHRAGFPAMKNPCALFPDFDGIPRRGRGFSGITGLRGPPCSSHKA